MRVLLVVARSREYARALDAIAVAAGQGGVDRLDLYTGDDDQAHRYDNITAKSERARQMAVAGGYDALWSVDDDQVVPPDALERLIAADADIAYGLTVWRNAPHRWSAIMAADGDDTCVTLDMQPERARAAWESVIDVVGCGTFCTLIRRAVLERFTFERRGRHCWDWYLAADAVRVGFSQRCDTGLIVSHMLDGQRVLNPIIDGRGLPGWGIV